MKQSIVTLAMEGVLTPEIWIAVSEKTGIPELRRTTRDEPDYDKLMRGRLAILDQHGLKLSDIQDCIGTLSPLPGAKEFLDDLRSFVQVVILSDTFEQFAATLLRQLNCPPLPGLGLVPCPLWPSPWCYFSKPLSSPTINCASGNKSGKPWPRSSG